MGGAEAHAHGALEGEEGQGERVRPQRPCTRVRRATSALWTAGEAGSVCGEDRALDKGREQGILCRGTRAEEPEEGSLKRGRVLEERGTSFKHHLLKQEMLLSRLASGNLWK